MPKPAQKELSINLLPTTSVVGTSGILQSAISYSRFFLLLLNIVAAIALFIQLMLIVSFTLSYERIKDSLSTISESQTVETSVNEIASRLKFVKQVRAQGSNFAAVDNVGSIIPKDLTITELGIEENKLILKGRTLDIRTLSQMASLTNSSKYFTNFTLTQVTVPGSNSSDYIIGATVDIKEGT